MKHYQYSTLPAKEQSSQHNFNLEMAQEMVTIGIDSRIGILEDEEKGSSKDWIDLEKRINVCTEKNYEMQVKSLVLSKKNFI